MSPFPHLFAKHSRSAWASRETAVGGGLAGGSCTHRSKWLAHWLVPWPPQHPLPHTFLAQDKENNKYHVSGQAASQKGEKISLETDLCPLQLSCCTPPQPTSTTKVSPGLTTSPTANILWPDSPPPFFLSWIFSLGVYFSWASQVSLW